MMKKILLFPLTVLSALAEKGIQYWLTYWYCYLYLTLEEFFKTRRIPVYNNLADGKPEKQGFLIPKEEEVLEYPKQIITTQECDSAYCFGINSKSEFLLVKLSHLSKKTLTCSLTLRLSDGTSYYLPEEHANQIRSDEPDTYGSTRIKMQCNLPMRKWRIFFNGLLREVREDDNEDPDISNSVRRFRHVKLSAVYTASAGIFDFQENMSSNELSKIASNNSSLWKGDSISFIKDIKREMDAYEQPGMFLGTVTVDNEVETELNLWGCRGRSTGTFTNEKPTFLPWELYAQMENGALIRLCEKEISPGKKTRLAYGYVMRQNGFIFPIESCTFLHKSSEEAKVSFQAGPYEYSIAYKVKQSKNGNIITRGFSEDITLADVDVTVNDKTGKGLLYMGSEVANPSKDIEFALPTDISPSKELSIAIWNKANSSSSLSGGKGSSLCHLHILKKGYSVPKGIIVTTESYQKFIERSLSNVLDELEKKAPLLSTEELSMKCKETVKAVSEAPLPDSIADSITKNLEDMFGTSAAQVKFAVRSSATGEDTDQMSAAGQMDTFLGVRGIKEILHAVKKCWASQFAFVAVQYKRQYGQKLNSPMAVVIQEMVPCDIAGVAFSCDPLTGNPMLLSITANYGLGESVVSATAEPDTIVLKRDINDQIFIHSRNIGSKKIMISMDENSGVKETLISEKESKECCINDEMTLRLGEIVLMLEKRYGNPRDIEWGISDSNLFLLQCRPVTSIDAETDYEIKHFGDGYLRTEKEFISTANVGEVMPGATSPLGLDYVMKYQNASFHRSIVNWEGEPIPMYPYYFRRITSSMNHVVMYMIDGFIRLSETDTEGEGSDHSKALGMAITGKIVDDSELIRISKDRHGPKKPLTLVEIIKAACSKMCVLTFLFFGSYYIKRTTKTVEKVKIEPKKRSSASEILDVIAENYCSLVPALTCHMDLSASAPLWNQVIFSILVKENGGWSNAVYSDFAHLVSTLKNVESADIPNAVKMLSQTVAQSIDPKRFRNMSEEEALLWLTSSSSNAVKEFKQFLDRHGHRCIKEFDLYSKPWATDPKPLIKMLQGNVRDEVSVVRKKSFSENELFSNLTIKVGFLNRIIMRLVIPQCRRGVREREMTKSLLIRCTDKMRKVFSHLAEAMVAEGRIPNKDLMYFLNIPELKKLIETRSPRLVTKAFRRWKCHPELDSIIFPETIQGVPKPINLEEDPIDAEEGYTMTGIPVSRGVVKATARVVLNLEEAKTIQPGDVLITYSTDIGWSPYFPMLSGVVTELGGLISHGAVVAREYGLPCVVGLHGAIKAFKSGDYVMLNGNEGFLKKLKSA